MEERVALPQFIRTGFGAEVAIRTIGSAAFETGAKVKGANIVAAVTVGAGFPGIGKIHEAGAVRLQQHLDQRVGTSSFAEVLLIMNKQPHEARHQSSGYSNYGKVAGHHQPDLIIQRLKK